MPDLIKPGTEKNPVFAKTDKEKSEVLVDYFSSVFTVESDLNNMPPFAERDYNMPLEDLHITEDMVNEKLKKLKINKSPGPDNIHPRVLNSTADSLKLPLSIIFDFVASEIRDFTPLLLLAVLLCYVAQAVGCCFSSFAHTKFCRLLFQTPKINNYHGFYVSN